MKRWLVFAAMPGIVGLLNAPSIHAQSPGAGPAFEVASVKLNTSCQNGAYPGGTSPGRVTLSCVSLRGLIRGAYGGFVGENMNSRRLDVLGGPAWIDTDRYDLSAKAAGGASPAKMMGPMLQSLLEERFKVKVHMEPRETPVYSLTVAKANSKLQPSKEGSCTPMDLNSSPGTRLRPGDPMPRICGGGSQRAKGGTLIADWYGVTMAELAGRVLSGQVDRPVVDKTGLTGHYDVHLEFVRGAESDGPVLLDGVPVSPAEVAGANTSGPSIFTALRDQLGLKLSAEKGSLDVIVIDHAEKPSGN